MTNFFAHLFTLCLLSHILNILVSAETCVDVARSVLEVFF